MSQAQCDKTEAVEKVIPKVNELFVVLKSRGGVQNKELVWRCSYVEGPALVAYIAHNEFSFSDDKGATSRIFMLDDYDFNIVTDEFLAQVKKRHK